MTAICTNIVIGWHKGRFNTRVATRGPVPFYHLIQELNAEATGIPLQLRMVAEGAIYMYRAPEVPEEENQTDSGESVWAVRAVLPEDFVSKSPLPGMCHDLRTSSPLRVMP